MFVREYSSSSARVGCVQVCPRVASRSPLRMRAARLASKLVPIKANAAWAAHFFTGNGRKMCIFPSWLRKVGAWPCTVVNRGGR